MYVKEELIPKLPFVFESRDVIKLVRLPGIFLNKLVERRLYGIRPSIRTGRGRGRRRLFNVGDVYSIALVWWLFQSGLRSTVISRVLRDITRSKRPNADLASGLLLLGNRTKPWQQALMVERGLGTRRESQAKVATQRVAILGPSAARSLVAQRPDSSVQIIPVGRLLADLMERMRALKPDET